MAQILGPIAEATKYDHCCCHGPSAGAYPGYSDNHAERVVTHRLLIPREESPESHVS